MNFKKKLADLLCSPLIGKGLVALFNKRIPSLTNPGYRFSVPLHHSSSVIHASIFWGIYESAETRLIKKHLLPDLAVVELGGSLGIISSFIVRRLHQETSLVVVEANPNLIATIQENILTHNRKNVSTKIVNKAIGYTSSHIYMSVNNDNTASRAVLKDNNDGSVKMACIRLNDIIPNAPYVLVCDIEGSEIEILLYDKEALRKCKQLFIELHDTFHMDTFYSREDLLKMIIKEGFELKSKDGHVYFFARN